MKQRPQNWYSEDSAYIFTFAVGREAISVRVVLKNGTIAEDEVDKLRRISEQIIQKGLPDLDIGPRQLRPISVADYFSDWYTHPADAPGKTAQ